MERPVFSKLAWPSFGVVVILVWLVLVLSYTKSQCSMHICRGAYWGSLRAAVQPMFHHSNLIEYAAIINQAVDALIKNLQTVARSGEQVDIHQQLGRMTMQVIGGAAFGWGFA